MARKAQKNRRNGDAARTVKRRLNTSWVRHRILLPPDRLLQVLVYARFSTDEQDDRSIAAQDEYCIRFLENLEVKQFEVFHLKDEGISGEELMRPGIDQVRDGIGRKAWDFILVEDSSRLYRDPAFCIQLVRSAVQQGIRVICINDYVDTAEEDRWEEGLYEAQRHHSSSNKYTILRIKRSQDERWSDGAAMGHLQSGYRRIPTLAATEW